jgi:NADH:ubiquinone oxidoreductase subunit 6 (subunit J)
MVFFSLKIIFNKNTLFNIFYLILVFICGSILCLTFGLEYVSLLFISIYVGAISVLFIFVVMMLQIYSGYTIRFNFYFFSFFCFIFLLIIFYFLEVNYYTLSNNFLFFNDFGYLNSITVFGFLVFKSHFILLYLCSFVLFVALFGSVYILINIKSVIYNVRSQKIYNQLSRTSGFFKKK